MSIFCTRKNTGKILVLFEKSIYNINVRGMNKKD